MGAVVVGIGHNDDLVVISVFNLKFGSNPGPDRVNDRIKLLVFHHVIELGLFGV